MLLQLRQLVLFLLKTFLILYTVIAKEKQWGLMVNFDPVNQTQIAQISQAFCISK